MLEQPLVSVIIPVHNVEPYIRQGIESVVSQTYQNLEIICIDDGSTDNSMATVNAYALNDSRIRIIGKTNEGQGVARNVALDRAQGTYVCFLDSDDYYESNFVEASVKRLEETGADIAVASHGNYHQAVGVGMSEPWVWGGEIAPKRPRSWRDDPCFLFQTYQSVPWNKVLRRDFIEEHHLRFQEIWLTEDLMFSMPALVEAKSIVCVYDTCVWHRVGIGTNSMSFKDRHPLSFLEAFYALKDYLDKKGLFDDLKDTFLHWTVGSCFYNLHTLKTFESFQKVFYELRDHAFQDLGVLDVDLSFYRDPYYPTFIRIVSQELTPEQFYAVLYATALERMEALTFKVFQVDTMRQEALSDLEAMATSSQDLVGECSAMSAVIEKAREDYSELLTTAEYRYGKVLCKPFRAVMRFTKIRQG